MAIFPLKYRPTVDVEQTPSLNQQGWSVSSLIRFRQSLVEALLGWQAICTTAVTGTARAMHFWTDLSGISRYAIGTNSHLYLFPAASPSSDPLIDITPVLDFTPGSVSSGSSLYSLLIWSLDNFGEDLIAVPSKQGLFLWTPSQGPTPATPISSTAVLTGGEVPANINLWNPISNGGFTISVNGATVSITGLNFTADTTITQVAHTIQVGMSGFTVAGAVTPSGNWQFTLTSTVANTTLGYAGPPVSGTDISTQVGWTVLTATSLNPGGAPPSENQGMLVLDQIQIIMCYGCNPLGSSSIDAMLVRWCDQGDFTNWVASTSNQAGSYRLPHGSRIIGGLQVPGMALLWTDVGVWAVQYIGFPLVFSFQNIGQNSGLVSQKASVCLGQLVYWMSDHGFFVMSGSGPQQMPCPVWDVVFKNLDIPNRDKIIAGTDYFYSEVYWFYPSANGGHGEIDSYVKVNIETNSWDYGPATSSASNQYSRTAWTDQNQPGNPVSVDLSGLLQQSDTGFTANGSAITGCTVRSGYSDIANGKQMMACDQFIPDFQWGGDSPEIYLTLYFRSYPGETPTTMGPFIITPNTKYITLRKPTTLTIGSTSFTAYPAVRGREVAVQIDLVSGWYRWGNNRLRANPAGELP